MNEKKLVLFMCECLGSPKPSLADSKCYSQVLAQDILNVWLVQKAGRRMALLSTNKRNCSSRLQLLMYYNQLVLHTGLASEMYGKNLIKFDYRKTTLDFVQALPVVPLPRERISPADPAAHFAVEPKKTITRIRLLGTGRLVLCSKLQRTNQICTAFLLTGRLKSLILKSGGVEMIKLDANIIHFIYAAHKGVINLLRLIPYLAEPTYHELVLEHEATSEATCMLVKQNLVHSLGDAFGDPARHVAMLQFSHLVSSQVRGLLKIDLICGFLPKGILIGVQDPSKSYSTRHLKLASLDIDGRNHDIAGDILKVRPDYPYQSLPIAVGDCYYLPIHEKVALGFAATAMLSLCLNHDQDLTVHVYTIQSNVATYVSGMLGLKYENYC